MLNEERFVIPVPASTDGNHASLRERKGLFAADAIAGHRHHMHVPQPRHLTWKI
jgi:hypothetical protein